MKYDHLKGLQFNMEDRNCYTLLRDFYRDNFDIELSDYPCPTNWFSSDLDLYTKLAPGEGFTLVDEHPRDWRPGDVIMMAIQSSSGSHVAILLDNGNILHHLVGQLSCETAYGGLFRNRTIGVYRHKDVPDLRQTVSNVDLTELLPAHVKRRLQEARQKTEEAAG